MVRATPPDDGQGIPDNTLPPIASTWPGPERQTGLLRWDKNNFAPRVAVAWRRARQVGSGADRRRPLVRGGYSMVYDRIGQALAQNFDVNGRLRAVDRDRQPVRRQRRRPSRTSASPGSTTCPRRLPSAPARRLPGHSAPTTIFTIYSSIDDTLKTPYAHTFNVVVGHELGRDFSIEAAYVGRQGTESARPPRPGDAAEPRDPASGTDYYTAAKAVITAAREQRLRR